MFYGVSSYGQIPYAAVPAAAGGITVYSFTYAETITVTETLAKKTTKTLAETITATDVAQVIKNLFLSLSETVIVSEELTKKTIKTLTESFSVTEALTSFKRFVRIFSEAITFTDTVRKKTTKLFQEVIVFLDRYSPYWRSVVKNQGETFTEVSVKPATPAYTGSTKPQDDIWIPVDPYQSLLKINATDYLLINTEDRLIIRTYTAGKEELVYSDRGTSAAPTYDSSASPTGSYTASAKPASATYSSRTKPTGAYTNIGTPVNPTWVLSGESGATPWEDVVETTPPAYTEITKPDENA